MSWNSRAGRYGWCSSSWSRLEYFILSFVIVVVVVVVVVYCAPHPNKKKTKRPLTT